MWLRHEKSPTLISMGFFLHLLCFLKRYHPASGENKINVDDETTDDAVLAVKAIAKQKGIDSRNIFILGHSQDGMMMLRILNHTPDKSVRGSMLLAALSRTLPELMLEQFAYLVSLNQLPKEQLAFFQQQFAILQDPSFSAA